MKNKINVLLLRKFFADNLSFIEDNNLAMLEYHAFLFDKRPQAYDYFFNLDKECGWQALAEKDRELRRNNFLTGIRNIIGESAVQALKYK